MKIKHLSFFLSAFIIAFGAGFIVAHAQAYTPLAPLPGTYTEASGVKTTNISLYVSGAIKLIIALGAALAVLFAIIGGTQYVAASITPSAKKDALERVQHALVGLAIILTSYLLLNSINPALVNVRFDLKPVTVARTPGLMAIAPPEATWPDDSAVRNQLPGITVTGTLTSSPCKTIGEKGCTSVYQLGANAINKLNALKDSCAGCNITVLGGTEYWNHGSNTSHRPGNSVVDLRKDNVLSAFIQLGVSLGHQTVCSSLGPAFRVDGPAGSGIYVDEGSHWHVCY